MRAGIDSLLAVVRSLIIVGHMIMLQYCVSLQSIEELTDEYKLKAEQPPTVITHVTQHAVSFFYAQSEVKLHIPLTATPTFFTDVGKRSTTAAEVALDNDVLGTAKFYRLLLYAYIVL